MDKGTKKGTVSRKQELQSVVCSSHACKGRSGVAEEHGEQTQDGRKAGSKMARALQSRGYYKKGLYRLQCHKSNKMLKQAISSLQLKPYMERLAQTVSSLAYMLVY